MANGRFTATRASVRSLVLRAYGLQDSQLAGGPGWIDMDRFDIDARALGLKLQAERAQVPVRIIDSVEHPTEN